MKLIFLSFFLLIIRIAAAQTNTPPGGTDTAMKDTTQLKTVIVRGSKPLVQQRSDGIVVNVENSLLSKGSSALEVLERSPGVLIDHRNNSLVLNGKPGVMVMLNGKTIPPEQALTLLNNMSADNIEKIELLTTPPSKYDAEGSAGLINIILKKNRRPGTNGSLSLTGGYGWGEKASGSLNLDHNTGKIDLYGSYCFSHDRGYQQLFGQGTELVSVLGGQTDFTFLGLTKPIANSHNATLGLEDKITPNLTIGGSINYNDSRSDATHLNQTDYIVLPDSLLPYKGTITGKDHWQNSVSSLYLEKQLHKNEKLALDLDYLYYNNNSPTDVYSVFPDTLLAPSRQKGFAGTTLRIGIAKIDYSKKLGQRLTLETGIKETYTTSSSRSGIEDQANTGSIASAETAIAIHMHENISALYVSANTQLTPSTTLAIGARYEYSQTQMTDAATGKTTINRRLGRLFPNLSLSGKFNEKTDWQLSYTERISRPSYHDLASYVAYNDAVSVFTGNPFLKPTITRNLKLGSNYHGTSFSLLFSRDENPIAQGQLAYSPAGDIVYITPENIRWQNNLTLQTNIPVKVNNWWTMNYGFVGGWRRFNIDYTPEPVTKTYFGYSLNFSETVRLPHRYSAELSGWYNSLSYYGSGKVEGYGTLSAGIKKELPGDKGSFQLSANDLFRTMHVITYIGAITEEAFSTKARIDWSAETRKFPILKLTYTRSFGSGTGKNRQKDDRLDGERDRVR